MSSTAEFDDWLELDEFARKIKRHPRTIKRWTRQPDGLPYSYKGKTPIVHVPTYTEWLQGRMRRPNPRKRRVQHDCAPSVIAKFHNDETAEVNQHLDGSRKGSLTTAPLIPKRVRPRNHKEHPREGPNQVCA